MEIELRKSDREDPLSGFSALSFIPQTLGAAGHAEASSSESYNSEFFKNLFKSVASKGSTDFLKQSREIMKSYPDIRNVYSNDGDKPAAANAEGRPQGRRPALGRKRAQFSLKPISSQPVQNVDFSSIDNIADPEEYFLAFEQLEKADKELKRLRGEVQHHRSTLARERRPGILGRKASFKYNFSDNVDIVESNGVSQEEILNGRESTASKTLAAMDSTDIGHPKEVELPNSNNEILDVTEPEGSVPEKEKFNNILDKLLSSFKDLDEDDGTALLRESLQLKSIAVEKLRLPELHSLRRDDSRALNSMVNRKKLEDSQRPESSRILLGTPLAAISTLQRRISVKDQPEDVYSVTPNDRIPYCGDSFISIDKEKQSPSCPGYCDKVSEADKNMGNKETHEENVTELAPCATECCTENSYSKFDNDIFTSAGLNGYLEKEGIDMQLDGAVSEQTDRNIEDPTSICMNLGETKGLSGAIISAAPSFTSHGMDADTIVHGPDGTSQEKVAIAAQGESMEFIEISRDHHSQPSATSPASVQSEHPHVMPDEDNEGQIQASSAVSPRRGKKDKELQRKQKLLSRRQSLADAGLMWKSGVRRSTRVKSRPLQYWRGERFLYGRIHDSLATVIGVKSFSPAKDGKDAVLKVKSFVPDKYADLVAKAAL
ncbi:centromere protein C isoform X1 [Typha latifolia]|uniref:centromere protein C isoform X1 n=1 Tax=Typha latifolia TaxID=4733 RepID=UPI003C2FC025